MSTPVSSPVTVRRGHLLASWDAGTFSGSPAIAGPARFAALVGLEVPVGHQTVIADHVHALGALAALMTSDPDGTRIVTAPSELLEQFPECVAPPLE